MPHCLVLYPDGMYVNQWVFVPVQMLHKPNEWPKKSRSISKLNGHAHVHRNYRFPIYRISITHSIARNWFPWKMPLSRQFITRLAQMSRDNAIISCMIRQSGFECGICDASRSIKKWMGHSSIVCTETVRPTKERRMHNSIYIYTCYVHSHPM